MIDRKRDLGAIARTIVDSNLYMTLATAEELSGADLDWGIGGASVAGGTGEWGSGDVRPPAPHRLYRAIATGHWVLDPDEGPDRRMAVEL